MTSGMALLTKNGIVLAVDSRAIDERGVVKSDNDQKLFQLGRNTGLIIAGRSPDDDLFNAPISYTVKQLRLPTLLSVVTRFWRLLKNFCSNLLAAADGCVHFIFGDYDEHKGYLLLKCGLGYMNAPRVMDDGLSHTIQFRSSIRQ